MNDNRRQQIYGDVAESQPTKRFGFLPSLETVCLFLAVALALTAIVIPLLPKGVVDWLLAHVG